ncbi:Helix-turn-helix domain protein [compost metagenome]
MRMYLPVQAPVLQRDRQDVNYQYQEYAPSPHLEAYVACYWMINFDAAEGEKLHRILPDGCVDIIFELGDATGGAFVAGLMTSYVAMNLAQSCSTFGIRFFSDTARRFLKYPVSEMLGNGVRLEDIWGSDAVLMNDEIRSVNGISEIIAITEKYLLKHLLQNKTESDVLLQKSMKVMYASQGALSMRALADHLTYNERTIRRVFQRELGISPKELSGIIRFQYLLQELNKGELSRYTDLAVKHGFYDQPHFVHQFKRFYGLPPTQVFK